MKRLLAFLLVIVAAHAFAHQDDTDVGRMPITHPDLGHEGGAVLHGKVNTAWTKVSDAISTRYSEHTAVANATLTTITHNLGEPISNIAVALYTGTGTSKVRVTDPATSGWTIAANGGNPNTQLDVTTPGSGGPHTFSVELTGSVGVLADSTIYRPSIDGGTATNANKIVVPKNTTTNLNALTRTQAAIYYDTTDSKYKGDNGTSIITIGDTPSFPLLAPDGTALNPSYSYSDDIDTGIAGGSDGVLNFSSNNSFRLSLSPTALTSTVPVLVPDGTVSAPSYSFSSDTTEGLYLLGADWVGISSGIGTQGTSPGATTTVDASKTFMLAGGSMNTTTAFTPALTFGSTDTDLVCPTGGCKLAKILGVARETYGATTSGDMAIDFYVKNGADGNTDTVTRALRIESNTQLQATSGIAATPSYSFDTDVDTGMYRAGSNVIGWSAGGSTVASVSTTGFSSAGTLATDGLSVSTHGIKWQVFTGTITNSTTLELSVTGNVLSAHGVYTNVGVTSIAGIIGATTEGVTTGCTPTDSVCFVSSNASLTSVRMFNGIGFTTTYKVIVMYQ